jgi:UDP-N-acetyl-D-mannosaminuronate dehydrogenase
MKNKIVSVWGIGYLGYTTISQLQEYGFKATIFDFTPDRLDKLSKGFYPKKEQFNSWSRNGNLPLLDLDKIVIADEYSLLFDNKVHFISFPNTELFTYIDLANIFLKNKDKLQNSLIIFESAGIPNSIQKDFINILKDDDIDVVTLFRNDWIIEDFSNQNHQKICSGNSKNAIKKIKIFLNIFNQEVIELDSLEEAELYANTKNSFDYTITAFFNQLSLAYPHININNIFKKLLNNMDTNKFNLGVNSVDYKSEQSIENILRGSRGDFLSILKEANNTNISFLFYYIDLLKTKNINSVTIFGLSAYNNIKDIRFSPSVLLAEYLNKEGITVFVYDDNFTQDELKQILPFSKFLNIHTDTLQTDAIFIMNLMKEYKFFTQTKMDDIGISKIRYIFDNTGFFKYYKYNDKSIYHELCDGNLLKVID